MKNLTITIFALVILSFQAYSQDSYDSETILPEPKTSKLTIEIHGLKSDKGTVKIGVYNSEGKWLSSSQFRQSSDIVDGTVVVVFENIPMGTYGISTYHDENNNLELDTNLFGIPSEPYASSRGAKGRFGPPKWKDAKFEIISSTHTEEIKY